MKKYKLNEYQYKIFKRYLNENAESRSQKKAIQFLMDNGKFPKDKAEQLVRVNIRNIFKILGGNHRMGKFMYGITRLWFNIMKQFGSDYKHYINSLDIILNVISHDEELYKKYNDNFNDLSLNELSVELKDEINYYVNERENVELGNLKNIGKENYKVVRINSFDDAKKFEEYTSWCICHYKDSYESYTDDGKNVFYFLLRKGYTQETKDDYKTPRNDDGYALSMIAVSVEVGTDKICTCNTRRNRELEAHDHQFDWVDISKLLGFNIKELIKENEDEIYTNYISNKYFIFHKEDDMFEFTENVDTGDIEGIVEFINNRIANLYDMDNAPYIFKKRKGKYAVFSQVIMNFMQRDKDLLNKIGEAINDYYYSKIFKLCKQISEEISKIVEIGNIKFDFEDLNDSTDIEKVISKIIFTIKYSSRDFYNLDDEDEDSIDSQGDFTEALVTAMAEHLGPTNGDYEVVNTNFEYQLIVEDNIDEFMNTTKYVKILKKLLDYIKNKLLSEI